MYYRVVGRQVIYSPSKKAEHDDEGLKALNGIDYGKVRFAEMLTKENEESMIKEFMDQFPAYDKTELKIEEFNVKMLDKMIWQNCQLWFLSKKYCFRKESYESKRTN